MPTKSLLRSIFRNSHQSKQKTAKDPPSTPTPTATATTSSTPSSTSHITLNDILISRTLINQPSTSTFQSSTSTTSLISNSGDNSPLLHKTRPQSRAKSRGSLLNPIFEERSDPNTPGSTDTTLIRRRSKCETRTATPFESSSSPYEDNVPSPRTRRGSLHGLFTPLHTSTVDFAIAPKTPSFPAQSYTQLLPAALQEAKLATHAHLDTLRTSLALLDALDGFSATVAVLREEFEEKVKTCEERLEMIGDVEGMVGDRMVEEWEGYMVK